MFGMHEYGLGTVMLAESLFRGLVVVALLEAKRV